MRIEKQSPVFQPIKITVETPAELAILKQCLFGHVSVDIFADICKSEINIGVSLKEVESCIQRLNEIMKL
jgi:acetylglutamate kinase